MTELFHLYCFGLFYLSLPCRFLLSLNSFGGDVLDVLDIVDLFNALHVLDVFFLFFSSFFVCCQQNV